MDKSVVKNNVLSLKEDVDMDLYLEAVGSQIYIEEEAKFNFLPRFKDKEEYSDLYDTLEDAEDLLNDQGVASRTSGERFGKVALRILDLYYNIVGFVTLVNCITIVGIPVHLLGRLIEWAVQWGKEEVANSYASKIIASLNRCKEKEKDPKKKKVIEDKIEQVKKKQQALRKS